MTNTEPAPTVTAPGFKVQNGGAVHDIQAYMHICVCAAISETMRRIKNFVYFTSHSAHAGTVLRIFIIPSDAWSNVFAYM